MNRRDFIKALLGIGAAGVATLLPNRAALSEPIHGEVLESTIGYWNTAPGALFPTTTTTTGGFYVPEATILDLEQTWERAEASAEIRQLANRFEYDA